MKRMPHDLPLGACTHWLEQFLVRDCGQLPRLHGPELNIARKGQEAKGLANKLLALIR